MMSCGRCPRKRYLDPRPVIRSVCGDFRMRLFAVPGLFAVAVMPTFTNAGCSTGSQAESASPGPGGRGAGGGAAVPVTASQVVQKAIPLEVRVIGTVEA